MAAMNSVHHVAGPGPGRTRGAGLATSLRAGLNAGLAVGAIQGLADGLVALARKGAPSLPAKLGCLGTSVMLYCALWTGLLVSLSLVLHPWFAKRESARSLGQRLSLLVTVGLALALFFELYWWTRPYVFWGRPATDPRRLAAALGMLIAAWFLSRAAVGCTSRLSRSLRWGLACCVPVLFGFGLVFGAAARGDAKDRGAVNPRNRELPNVLLFVVDAMRQDVLSSYGHPRVKTPAMDRLAARGVLFERAWCQAPFTWTSFGSLLTGKYPRRHGLVRMEPGYAMVPNITLPWHLKTASKLAGSGTQGARMRDEDWVGAAFLTGTLSQGSGLIRGFDQYYEAMVGHGLVVADSPLSVFRSELLFDLVREKVRQRFDKHPAASVARKWLSEHSSRRFVAMAHYYTTHTPYDPPSEFRARHCDPAYAGPIHSFYADARIAIESGKYVPSDADKAQIAHLYYAGVEQADAMIGEVLDELERKGVLDDTLVIVTSDHGEELGEHGLWEHNHMYETNLLVPLIMSWPKGMPQGVRVPALVELVDVVPTVCALLGLEPPYEKGLVDPDGKDRGAIDGQNLVPLMRGEVSSVRTYSYSENSQFLALRDERFKLIVPASALSEQGWEQWLAGTLPKEVGRPELFDLEQDAGETRECSAQHPEELKRLLAALRAWDATMPVPRSAMRQSDRDREAELVRFRNLGYTEHGVGGKPELVAPKGP